MEQRIDPRLFAPALTSTPQHSGGQPYYLPSPTQHQQSPQLAQATAPSNVLDPSLAHASPVDASAEHDDDEHDDDGDIDGYGENILF
jgi:hypothetical protein